MKPVRFRLDGRPCTIQDLRQPMNGHKAEDYISLIDGKRYDFSKWFEYKHTLKI